MVAALDGAGELWPASVVLDGEYGIDGCGDRAGDARPRGRRAIHEWELAPGELAALHASAEFVRAAAASIGPESGHD